MAETEKDSDAPGLEHRLDRLEAIVASLEDDELELEAAMALFEEGVAHLRHAHEVLEAGTLRIERLLTEADGTVTTEPVEPGEAGAPPEDLS